MAEQGDPAQVPAVEPTEQPAVVPDVSGAVEPTPQNPDPSDEPAQEPDTDEPKHVSELRQENKRLRRQRSEEQNKVQRLIDERATAARERDEAIRAREDLELTVTRYQIVAARGLTLDWADRVHGATKEDIEADTEQLINQLNPGLPVATTRGFDGGARQTAPKPKAPVEAHNDLILKSLGIKR